MVGVVVVDMMGVVEVRGVSGCSGGSGSNCYHDIYGMGSISGGVGTPDVLQETMVIVVLVVIVIVVVIIIEIKLRIL